MSKTRRFAVLCAAGLVALSLVAADAALAQRGKARPTQDPNEGKVQTDTQPKQFPFGWSWSAVSLAGKPVGAERPTLTVDEGLRGSGFGGCNTFSASMYPIKDQGFAVGPLAVTKRACDKAISATEHSFLLALRLSQKWDIVGGKLILKTGRGDLVFERSL